MGCNPARRLATGAVRPVLQASAGGLKHTCVSVLLHPGRRSDSILTSL
jgi:hypothetical protein